MGHRQEKQKKSLVKSAVHYAIKRIISDKAPKEYNVSVLFYGKSKYLSIILYVITGRFKMGVLQ